MHPVPATHSPAARAKSLPASSLRSSPTPSRVSHTAQQTLSALQIRKTITRVSANAVASPPIPPPATTTRSVASIALALHTGSPLDAPCTTGRRSVQVITVDVRIYGFSVCESLRVPWSKFLCSPSAWQGHSSHLFSSVSKPGPLEASCKR